LEETEKEATSLTARCFDLEEFRLCAMVRGLSTSSSAAIVAEHVPEPGFG
jgi:hypothetical protein